MKNLLLAKELLAASFMVVFLFYGTILSAQDRQLLQEVPESNLSRSSKGASYLAELRKDKSNKSVVLVRFGNLATLQKNGILTFYLPGSSKPTVSHAIRVEYQDDDHYSYYGTTSDGVVSIHIRKNESVFSGYFLVDGESYSIRPCEGEVHAIVTHKKSEGFTCLVSEKYEISPKPTKSGRVIACLNPIRVLILYTQNALNAKGGNISTIQSIANDAIAQFNSCIYRSNIPTS